MSNYDDNEILYKFTADFISEFGFAAVMGDYGFTKHDLLELVYPGRFREWDFTGYDWSKPENRRKAVLHVLRSENAAYLPAHKFFNRTAYHALDYHHKMIDFYNEVYDIDIKEEYSNILEKIRTGDAPEDEMCEKYHIDHNIYRKQGKTDKEPNTIHMIKVLTANGLLDRKEEAMKNSSL